jgi:anti-anti-sigma factor
MVDEFEADISVRGDELWVLPTGDLDIGAAPELAETLSLAMASDAKSIVIDLRGLEFIDSTGLRTLLEAQQSEGGERPRTVGVPDRRAAGRAAVPTCRVEVTEAILCSPCAPTSSASRWQG